MLIGAIFGPSLFKKKNKVGELENGNIVISAADLSEKAKFYSHVHEGIEMEFFAVKDSKGKIRMAFNRCEVCYETGRGYFKQEGDVFVCQNCGNRYTISMIGNERGGCNPSPITSADRKIEDDQIVIFESVFSDNHYMFR